MKRDDLKALELTDEQVNSVMKMYGKAVAELQNGLSAAQSDSESAKAELKKYQKDGEYYIDKNEYKRLKTFETDTLTRETNAKKTAALTKLYKGANASDSVTKLLISNAKLDEIELDEKDEVKGGSDILKKAKADYADLFAGNGNAGVPHNPDVPNGGGTAKKVPVVC